MNTAHNPWILLGLHSEERTVDSKMVYPLSLSTQKNGNAAEPNF